jgi:glycosyltransferase involved in cell wall biosynthesis
LLPQKMSGTAEPVVSICMPAFNVERTVGEALASVLAQTYRRIEVVFVDDGSTDATAEVVRSIEDPRVRYYQNSQNLGGFQTMNRAVSLARGEFIAIYHSDDVYFPRIVEKEVAHLQKHPQVGAVFCLDEFMDVQGQVFGGMTLPDRFAQREWLGYEEVFPFMLRHKNVLFCCPTFMTRRCVLEAVGPFDAERYDIVADVDMWIRIVRRYPVAILNERLMRYRVGKGQWSKRYNRLRTEQERYFSVMDHYLHADQWLRKLGRTDLIEYRFHRCDDETVRAANLVIRGDPLAARALLRKRYPWRTLFVNLRRRKLRVLLLRTLMRAGLRLGLAPSLARLLVWTEYGGRM